MHNDERKPYALLANAIMRLVALVVILALVILYQALENTSTANFQAFSGTPQTQEVAQVKSAEPVDFFAQSFDVSKLGNSKSEELIKYGHELIENTNQLIGPDAANQQLHFAGNRLSCKNCHLQNGTKPFAIPYIGINGLFPQYRGREDKVGSIEERINGCMTRSMNGQPLQEDSKEMRAMVAYMNWLSKGVPTGSRIAGSGLKPIHVPDRKVNIDAGSEIYAAKCVACHGDDGGGQLNTTDGTYLIPPLSGTDTYNDGAGMHRVLTAAAFIKYNMPLGASIENPILSDEEAFDVAGYINTLQRPHKSGTETDYPNLKMKPVSTPYGPFEDAFTAEQHKFGPFPEIISYYKNQYGLNKQK